MKLFDRDKGTFVLVLVLVGLTLLGPLALAQQGTTAIVGDVLDPQGNRKD